MSARVAAEFAGVVFLQILEQQTNMPKKQARRETSPRFTDNPRDVISRVPLDAMLAKAKPLPVILPAHIKITYLPAKRANGATMWPFMKSKQKLSGKITSALTVTNAFKNYC